MPEDSRSAPAPNDPVAAHVALAGLHYVSDNQPGITRRRVGMGFGYRDPDGAAVRDADTLQHIRMLVSIRRCSPVGATAAWQRPRPERETTANGNR